MIKELTKDFSSIQELSIVFRSKKVSDLHIKYVDILEMNNNYREFASILIKLVYDNNYIDKKLYDLQYLLFSERVIDRLSGINICRKVLKLERCSYENS